MMRRLAVALAPAYSRRSASAPPSFFLVWAAVFLIGAPISAQAEPHTSSALAASQRPSIVVVLVDDLRWDEMSCAGHPFVRTPHIDRIAHEGARFRNAFCNTPLCSPARASWLTGLYMHRHGIVDNTNRSKQSHRLATFPRDLHAAGYATAFIGKWHMGNDDTARPGFTYWACMKGQGSSFDPVLNINGHTVQQQGHVTDVLNHLAVTFLREHRDQPVCLYVSHKALHRESTQQDDGSVSDVSNYRFIPAPRHEKLYEHDAIPRRLNVLDDLTGKPALQRPVPGLPPLSRKTGTSDDQVRGRLRMLAGVDEGVGILLAELEKQQRLDNTLFVFTSDHGYFNGEHGLGYERRLAYEETIRVPLLIRYPKLVRPGILIDEFATSVDLAPTVLAAAGVDTGRPFDGRSLMPLLQGKAPRDWPTSVLIEYSSDTVFPRIHKMGYQAVRTQRWKYIRYRELQGMDELYDLLHDPYEMQNLIKLPKAQSIVAELQAEMERLRGDAAAVQPASQ